MNFFIFLCKTIGTIAFDGGIYMWKNNFRILDKQNWNYNNWALDTVN